MVEKGGIFSLQGTSHRTMGQPSSNDSRPTGHHRRCTLVNYKSLDLINEKTRGYIKWHLCLTTKAMLYQSCYFLVGLIPVCHWEVPCQSLCFSVSSSFKKSLNMSATLQFEKSILPPSLLSFILRPSRELKSIGVLCQLVQWCDNTKFVPLVERWN